MRTARFTMLLMVLAGLIGAVNVVGLAQENADEPDYALYYLERSAEPFGYDFLWRVEFRGTAPSGQSYPILDFAGDSPSLPAFSPDGSTILFAATPPFLYSESGYKPQQIYAVSPFGGNIRTISPADRYYTSIAWAPDGQQFAVFTNPVTDAIAFRLALMDADGTTRRETNIYSDMSDAIWLPDGRQIALLGTVDGQRGLLVVDVAAGTITADHTDVNIPFGATGINWLTDDQLIFTAAEDEPPLADYRLFQYDLTTDTMRVLIEDLLLAEASVQLSPDKTMIAAFIEDADRNFFLTVLDSVTHDMLQQVPVKSFPNEFEHGKLAWSPDSALIAFSQYVDIESYQIAQVFVLDVATGDLSQVSSGEKSGVFPQWQPVVTAFPAVGDADMQ